MDIKTVRKLVNAYATMIAICPRAGTAGAAVHDSIKEFFLNGPDGHKSEMLRLYGHTHDQKIPAIKHLRTLCPGLGLKEAKDWVEANIPTYHVRPTTW